MKNQTKDKYIAKTLFGLENVLADELRTLGAENIKIANRAVNFSSDLDVLYKINLASRTALRILHPILTFRAKSTEQLYSNAKKYNWHQLIKVRDTFAIDSVTNSTFFRHSKYAALKLKDAIVDQIRERTNSRPNINPKNPDIRLNLHIENNEITISLDSTGESLHRRGYRLQGEKAPLNEVLAAGMILLSDWDRNSNFIDPLCGSGTLAIEAALIALNLPPNLHREKFAFMTWKNFNKKMFQEIKSDLISKKKNFPHKIIGNEINGLTLTSAKANAKRAKVDFIIDFRNEDFFKMNNELNSGTIVTNPPYGERMRTEDINEFYKTIGDTLKNNYKGFSAWILSSNKDALKHFGLRTSKKLTLFNGALECKFHNYTMYEGSLKKKHER